MPSRFCRHASPNFMGTMFTGLIKTRCRWTTPRKFGFFLFETAKGQDIKKWLLLETFFAKLSTIGNKWLLLESFGEAAGKMPNSGNFWCKKSFHYWKVFAEKFPIVERNG